LREKHLEKERKKEKENWSFEIVQK